MSNIFQCKSSVSFSQACDSSNISIANNSFGLTRTGIIFVVSETILTKNVLDAEDVLYIWHNSLYVCEPKMFRLMRTLI